MAKKQKRERARREPAKGTTERDSIDNNNCYSAIADAAAAHTREVFDSSKYNAMSDMTKGSNMETINAETLADAQQATIGMKPERINNKSITNKTTTTASESSSSTIAAKEEEAAVTPKITPKITPMIVEERARTIREVNEEEEEMQQRLSSSSSSISAMTHQSVKEKKFVLYLNIMLSIENATIERLHARIQQSPLVEVREQLVRHLEETKEQQRRLITLIRMLSGQPTNERAILSGYSLPKVLEDAFKASATTPEEQEMKTMETDALIEYAEVIGYNMAIQLATRINIGEAIMPLRQNLQEEEKMVAWMRANLPSNFVQLWSKIDHEHMSQY
jgi:ferritin-like metal-binding protein YciE